MGTARSSPDRMEREGKKVCVCVLLGWQGATVSVLLAGRLFILGSGGV